MNEVAPDSIAQDEPAQDWSELCCGDAVYATPSLDCARQWLMTRQETPKLFG